MVCPQCSGAMRGNTCVSCGWERPARSGINVVQGELHEFRLEDLMEPRPGLRAAILKEPKKVFEAALVYTMMSSAKGEDHARRWAYGIWKGIYPKSKLGFGWFNMAVPTSPDLSAYNLIEREVKRFRKNAKRGRRLAA
ncbi:MAG TPA: hypothetical protein ENN65_07600 [Candidatus Hydrogenedentes bacterium]|nr:hypothetical protein [Candidatus Hydrogenedentota bacterium]